ncbi:N-formylglutamate amidohydrolase [Sphingomonas paeninsulae]|uniref:N-formylglutamate amidohydrolase n=1 Tax=Sphingomonas paeninsulae TaxID=2319844 RepID=A0A494TLA2_SPHPE|nr:N-formylglutamate amidohydrolase [Sphingomonas paeninsulae]AYJ86198.1 N-formylglutamate amidohydrolase [Sphingomonas paeninsulae]
MNRSNSFEIFGPATPLSPVVVSVPHAGRDYPDLAELLRHPVERLRALEDRYADRLAERAIAGGVNAIVSKLPRLCIDLNRAEGDLDPAMVEGRSAAGYMITPRARGGLGLIPRRLNEVGDIWRVALSREEVRQRVEGHYRPYHTVLRAMLAAAQARFGVAILLDLHSMPPLAGFGKPTIVVGDRFGRTASPHVSGLAETVFTDAGFSVGRNAPYAGGISYRTTPIAPAIFRHCRLRSIAPSIWTGHSTRPALAFSACKWLSRRWSMAWQRG